VVSGCLWHSTYVVFSHMMFRFCQVLYATCAWRPGYKVCCPRCCDCSPRSYEDLHDLAPRPRTYKLIGMIGVIIGAMSIITGKQTPGHPQHMWPSCTIM
jgi:hypothetical protein